MSLILKKLRSFSCAHTLNVGHALLWGFSSSLSSLCLNLEFKGTTDLVCEKVMLQEIPTFFCAIKHKIGSCLLYLRSTKETFFFGKKILSIISNLIYLKIGFRGQCICYTRLKFMPLICPRYDRDFAKKKNKTLK